MQRAIHLSGIVLLVSFVTILMDDFNQEWKQIQTRFAHIEENRYHSTSESDISFNSGIAQIVVEGLGKIDRCPTCHLGVDDIKYRNAEPPFQTHPGQLLETHKSKDFGCSACHLGQGYAVSYDKAAHRKLEFWNETMWPRPLMQASCGTCHRSREVSEAPLLTGGRLLISEKGCTGCHDIDEFFEEGNRGPNLDGIGNKVSEGWLYAWLKNPRDYLKASRMPSYRLTDPEILDIVSFLLSLDGKSDPPHAVTAQSSNPGRPDSGAVLVSESRCISCHTIHGRGGRLAPELDRIGDKVRREWLPNFLRNVHYYQPEKRMLEYNFTDRNALDIAAYLMDEFSEGAYVLPDEGDVALAPKSLSRKEEQLKRGLKLFVKHGCGGCHSVGTQIKPPKVGPKLSNIGNRLESVLDFGSRRDIRPTLYNWLFMKLKQADVFDSSAAMPNYYLTDEEAFEITVALLGNKENQYATEYLVSEAQNSVYKKPSGEFGELFERYSCISCHSIDRYGGTLSTVPLTMEGSKVKFEWLRHYLIKPFALRPVLTERMPRFRMTEREASLMADYIKRVYVSDEIPRFFELELKPEEVALGRQLFRSLECVNCHIADGAGGYVGPELDNTGNRLEAGWAFKWLLDPLKYKPETIHPDFGFTELEARQLTAYLMTKRRDHR